MPFVCKHEQIIKLEEKKWRYGEPMYGYSAGGHLIDFEKNIFWKGFDFFPFASDRPGLTTITSTINKHEKKYIFKNSDDVLVLNVPSKLTVFSAIAVSFKNKCAIMLGKEGDYYVSNNKTFRINDAKYIRSPGLAKMAQTRVSKDGTIIVPYVYSDGETEKGTCFLWIGKNGTITKKYFEYSIIDLSGDGNYGLYKQKEGSVYVVFSIKTSEKVFTFISKDYGPYFLGKSGNEVVNKMIFDGIKSGGAVGLKRYLLQNDGKVKILYYKDVFFIQGWYDSWAQWTN